ncbi:cell division cycle protein 16 homolog [Eupeodes corollae]|uniref:cell division cycle protein 16 homolog n=1 Tax=Eupeodes corollae TaxID=290404 RepID=UPI0024907CE4|nr:cell division cycle protein 16 homolog [Eupeodes corollae]
MTGFINIEECRKLVKFFIDMRRYNTALFWAEKVSLMSENDPRDIYMQANCMFLLKEYQRAVYTIKYHGLEKTNIICFYLVLECLFESKEYNEAITLMNSTDFEFLSSSFINKSCIVGDNSSIWLDESNKNNVLASIIYFKGKIYEAMDNRDLAVDFYAQALHKSVFCFEALDALTQHDMLMASEENELLQHLPFYQQCTEAETKLVSALYSSKLKKYYETDGSDMNAESLANSRFSKFKSIKDLTGKIMKTLPHEVQLNKTKISNLVAPGGPPTNILSPANKLLEDLKNVQTSFFNNSLSKAYPNDGDSNRMNFSTLNTTKESDEANMIPLSACLARIEKSTDLLAGKALKLFYNCEYKHCLQVLNELLKIDPHHRDGLTVQIGCLVELKDCSKLFYLAHKLVDNYPEKALSWYAVGCYYDLIGKSDPARRYLLKATSLDRLYGPAWLAYGHSFAKENEHDQAMAAYFKATQLMRGCHLPLLYIGVECGMTKNLELAEQFFYKALFVAPLDVFILHELGIIKYEYQCYDSAEDIFRATVEIVTARSNKNMEDISPKWESLFNNLGHCCRKNKKYEEALKHHQFALLLKPQSAQTYTAIGYIYALMGNLEEAIVNCHKSLALNRDCVVTSTILKNCIEDHMESQNESEDEETMLNNCKQKNI